MAKAAKPVSVILLLLLTLIMLSFFSTMAEQGFSYEDELFAKLPRTRFFSIQTTIMSEMIKKKEVLKSHTGKNKMMRNSRRLMIGSTAPICTYNECRSCKYKCRAKQVPVEGNDPINSAYHYRCVCHR